MHIAIVHYHLGIGGVTRVIEHSARLLREAGHRVVTLTGGEAPRGFPVPARRVAELAYDEGRGPVSPARLKDALEEAAGGALGAPPDLWHIHNHHLGKNLSLPPAVAELAGEGQRLLLQIHDFPEDCRPYNYRRLRTFLARESFDRCLYPAAPQVHYAVLNGRDRAFLIAAGLPRERLHWLPNPVWLPPPGGEVKPWPGRLWFYPTRAIRRKNVGELLLWAALAGPGDHFATSLAPETPREQPLHRRWVALAEELSLPLSFALAGRAGLSFPALLRAAHCVVTTSVAEGFGMVFLEPWLLGQPLAGRDLAEISADFSGVDLGTLYRRLEVPVAWLGASLLRRRLRSGLESLHRHYGLPAPERGAYERAWRAWVRGGRVDFGRLDEALQTLVIRRLKSSPQAREELPQRLTVPPPEVVEQNRAAVAAGFGPQHYAVRLGRVYGKVAAAVPGPVDALDGSRMLRSFLQPERLFLLRL